MFDYRLLIPHLALQLAAPALNFSSFCLFLLASSGRLGPFLYVDGLRPPMPHVIVIFFCASFGHGTLNISL